MQLQRHIYLLILILVSFSVTKAQENSQHQISIGFVKDFEVLPSAGSFFNVIRIENNGVESFNGILRIIRPEGWNLIGSNSFEVVVEPGQTTFFPIRVSMPGNTLANVSFIISAELQSKDYYDYANSYVSIEPKSSWDMRVTKGEVYLSEFRTSADFDVRLINRGNVNELIKLNFAIGGLLSLRQTLDNDSILFVELPAYADTTIRFDVFMRTGLSYSVQRVLEQNWRSKSIYLKAITNEKELFSGIRVTPLHSSYFNEMPLKSSPLNAEINLYNLLSFQRPKMSARVHGKLLFPDNQLLNYTFGFYNVYFNKEANSRFDFFQQFRYMISYQDKRTRIKMADRLSTGMLHSLSGNGVEADYRMEKNTFSLSAVQNPYSKNYGVFSGYSSIIGKLAANSGVTLEATSDKRYSHYSLHLGGAYSFLSKHKFRLQTVTSLSNFASNRYSPADTSAVGFAYRLSYQLSDKRYTLRIDNLNTRLSYLRNSGINRIDGYFNLSLRDDIRLQSYFNRNSYVVSRYPYTFYFPGNQNLNENARIYLSYSKGNIIYQIGPQYFSNIRNYYNPEADVKTRYSYYQPGIAASTTFRLVPFRSVTPNLSFNTMHFNYSTSLPDDDPLTKNWRWQYTAGVNYYDQSLKINAYYSSGESSDLYRSAVVTGEPVINQAIHFRPYYERYLARETIKLSSYINYSFYMPSQRENTLINLTSEFYLTRGMNIYTSFNVYKTTRIDPEIGAMTNRSLNVMVGLRKAFDLQQPNVKHRSLKMIGFNDQNGDRMKNENEKPVSNILVNISRDPLKNENKKTGFSEINMITDPNGEIFYGKIPEGIYDLRLTPLSGLEDRFFLHGDKQVLEIKEDMIYYLPLIESNTVRGRVIIDRDPNSNEGRISLEGIRITATATGGETYSTLTNSNGNFVLNLPKASLYKVNIYNVFGEQFMLERGEYEVQFSTNRTVEVEFVFRERRRQIQFRDGEQFYEFNNIRRNN